MENALPLFGLAATLFAPGFVVRVGVASWLRVRQFERTGLQSPTAIDHHTADLATRFSRIEQIVEATATEVERIGEGQRDTLRLLAAPNATLKRPSRAPERVITPL